MDIVRPDIKRKKLRRNIVWIVVGVIVLGGAAFGVSRLKPAIPTVDASTVYTGPVTRGDLIVQRRGLGTLVPREDSIELIPAQTDATVIRIRELPGVKVTPDTILMNLSDPELQQKLLDAKLQLKQAEADYKSAQATLQSSLMDKKTAAAAVDASYAQDRLQAQTDKQLYQLGVISGLAYNKSKSTADQLDTQHQLSQDQIAINQKAIEVQLASSQTKIDQARDLLDLYQKQEDALTVRAGISGVLSPLPTPLQVGQHVTAGTSLAEVIQPNKLKASLQIAETQAHDIQIGQPAEIDTHNGIVQGHVIRIDPSAMNGTRTVDVSLDGPLPPGAVPQLSVDGTIDLQRLHDVLKLERPAFGNENSTIGLFRINPDGKTATRVQVKVGAASVSYIQILDGLKEGDRVILSDMSRDENTDQVRLE